MNLALHLDSTADRFPGHEAVVEVLGEDYQGVLVSDCFLAYDPLNFRKSRPGRIAS